MTPTCPKCGCEMEYEPADPNYGADADGNRGRRVPASWRCECGHHEEAREEEREEERLWVMGHDI